MYQSPKLERYGTFRELTLGGGTVATDPFATDTNDNVPDGCIDVPGPDNVCSSV